ncbi:ubiquinol oxidase subunit II [Kyrpidia spormannii]|uniref:Quinol oxidase subunit 2 n=2 Tax=Kyrpidia spormannii TaxID=2055160 RepID=A0ACA8ZA90_9BACL|nr:ubiquinol oxidase subunit II [Kyrpidia spormannii]CAB3393157.1 Quinol oxidase subunit 2 [Kyrpidia spormannii]CAB3394076.1 Quinol oxidase subunit 2 [Kyrpidia spormannii]
MNIYRQVWEEKVNTPRRNVEQANNTHGKVISFLTNGDAAELSAPGTEGGGGRGSRLRRGDAALKPVSAGRKSLLLVVGAAAALFLSGCSPNYLVLNPAGPVGREEMHLIVLSTVLVLAVVIPVFVLLAFIVWRYRDRPGNPAAYRPEWSESRILEIVWWGIPIVIVGVLGFYTAKTTFALTEPPESSTQPLTIQVTSLNWKWLFQYPGQGVATVNYCEIPVGVPVQFELTADSPMNSFWVPQLGGQEYAMPGMAMRLWLQADKPGTYYGHGANFTGEGFAHMGFNVVAVSQKDFDQWVSKAKSTGQALTEAGYQQLKKPGVMGTATYSSYPPGLFHDTVWNNGGRYDPKMAGMGGTDGRAGMMPKGAASMPGTGAPK